jgi:hypothetical protein
MKNACETIYIQFQRCIQSVETSELLSCIYNWSRELEFKKLSQDGGNHSRTQSPSYARCDEGLWPNPYPNWHLIG